MRRALLIVFVAFSCGSPSSDDGGSGGGTTNGGGTGGTGGGGTGGGAGGTGGGLGTGGGGFGGGSTLPCNTQPEAACLNRSDCTADFCFECSCTPTYMGCRNPADMKATCPILNCVQPQCCLNTGDCGGTKLCIGPGQSNCGTCMNGDCTTDGDCMMSGVVCAPAPCLCGGGMDKLCQAACTSTSCAEGEVCGNNGHCAPKACTNDTLCPRSFKCELDGGTGGCVRKQCGSPLECGKGTFCVEGGCSVGEGTCEQMQ